MSQNKLNDEITAKSVIFIDAEGEKHGVITLEDAKQRADEASLDLVQFSLGDTPVVKLMNYEKFIYQQKKSEKDKKKAQKDKGLKEIVLGISISPNDLTTKTNKVIELLEDKYKVKVAVRLRGRQLRYKPEAIVLVKKVCEEATGDPNHDVRVSDGLTFAILNPSAKK